VLRSQDIQCEGDGEQFRVRSGAEELLRVMFEEDLAGFKGDNFDAPHGGVIFRVAYVLTQSLAQL